MDYTDTVMGNSWPTPPSRWRQAKDMAGEKQQWDARSGFSFAVLTPDGSKELGCFCLRQSNKAGYDAVATLWAVQEEFDKRLEKTVFKDMKAWVSQSWPFQKVAWPGIEMTQAEWRVLPRKPR